jgi:hypothetical protein
MKRLQDLGRRLRPQQQQGIFGRALDDFPSNQLMEGIPLPVYRCVEHICRTGAYLGRPPCTYVPGLTSFGACCCC